MRILLSGLWRRAAIIGLCLASLGGCSAVRLGYNQGPQLAYWWLDGYLDFSDEQDPRVKESLAQWFVWHRDTQLDDYAELLAQARSQALTDATPAQVCRWGDELRTRLQPALARAVPLVAELVPTLTPVQLAHLERRFEKSNDELRKEFLQPNADARLQASVERAVDRFESIYGRLDDAQRRMVAVRVAVSPFDPQAWVTERQQRQQDVLRTLRRLVAERADAGRALPVLRQLAQRIQSAARPDMEAYAQRLTQYNCAFGAQIHNATNGAQRQHARDKLGGWEADLRQLAADRRPAAVQAASVR